MNRLVFAALIILATSAAQAGKKGRYHVSIS